MTLELIGIVAVCYFVFSFVRVYSMSWFGRYRLPRPVSEIVSDARAVIADLRETAEDYASRGAECRDKIAELHRERETCDGEAERADRIADKLAALID